MFQTLGSFSRLALGLAVLSAAPAAAQAQDAHDAAGASGRLIRVWGDDAMRDVLAAWEAGFQKNNPDVRFENKLYGTDTGIAGLYTGVADIALMGRDVYPVESMAFAWVQKYRPAGYQIGTGGLSAPGKSSALTVLVHKDNPFTKLTLAQLDAVFGYERRAGAAQPAKTWGDLGLTGDWANKPIHAYARRVDSGTAVYFRQKVMRNSNKWNWDILTEFVDKPNDGAEMQINSALASDPGGIGVSIFGNDANAMVKPIALAESAEHPAFLPTAESVGARAYPLARPVFAYVDQGAAKPANPLVTAFLQYVLSAEGQREMQKTGQFLPLPERVKNIEVEKFSLSQAK